MENPTIDYARANNIPCAAVQLAPRFDVKKRRIIKGEPKTYLGWDKSPFDETKVFKTVYGLPATAWFFHLKSAKMFIIDVDVKGGKKAQAVLKPEIWSMLWETSQYVVQTGSGGIHFYFLTDGSAIKTQTNVLKDWLKPGEEGESAIDICQDQSYIEGTTYNGGGQEMTYRSIKSGNSIKDTAFSAEVWELVYPIIRVAPAPAAAAVQNDVIIPEEISDMPPILHQAERVADAAHDEIAVLIDLLSAQRASDYSTWIQVGFALKYLYGVIPQGLDYFKDFSQKCPDKYNEFEVEKAYRGIKATTGKPLTKSSLHYWAKQDNLEKYREAFNLRMTWNKLTLLNQKELADIYHAIAEEKYTYSQGCWYMYEPNNLIKQLGKSHPDGLKRDVTVALQNELDKLKNMLKPDDEKYTEKLKLVVNCHKAFGSSQYINGVIDFVRPLYTNDDLAGVIDTNTNLLAFTNGVLDLKAKTFRPLTREDCCSNNTRYAFCETVNASARAELMQQLRNIFNTEEVVTYYLQTVAMSFFGNPYEVFYLHTGSGGNGKGVLFTLMKSVLGDYYYQAPSEFLTTVYRADAPNSALANAKNKRMFVMSEPSSQGTDGKGIKLSTDLLKALTGGDDINARDLYKSASSPWKATFTPWLQCNTVPELTKVDGGIRRRLIKQNYPNKFVENPDATHPEQKLRDDTLKDKLVKYEYFSEMMLMLWEITKDFKKFDIPRSVSLETKEFMDSSDKVLAWLRERCEYWLISGENVWKDTIPVVERITKKMAHDRYKADTGERITAHAFHNQMATNEVGCKKIAGSEYYLLRFKEIDENEEE